MAIIYSYPNATSVSATDKVIGTQYNPITEENKTVQFGIAQVATLASQNYLESTITVTNAQLTALQATDVQLITAPGANKYIKANTALLLTTAGAVGGGGGSSLQVKVRYQILDTSTATSF